MEHQDIQGVEDMLLKLEENVVRVGGGGVGEPF